MLGVFIEKNKKSIKIAAIAAAVLLVAGLGYMAYKKIVYRRDIQNNPSAKLDENALMELEKKFIPPETPPNPMDPKELRALEKKLAPPSSAKNMYEEELQRLEKSITPKSR